MTKYIIFFFCSRPKEQNYKCEHMTTHLQFLMKKTTPEIRRATRQSETHNTEAFITQSIQPPIRPRHNSREVNRGARVFKRLHSFAHNDMTRWRTPEELQHTALLFLRQCYQWSGHLQLFPKRETAYNNITAQPQFITSTEMIPGLFCIHSEDSSVTES